VHTSPSAPARRAARPARLFAAGLAAGLLAACEPGESPTETEQPAGTLAVAAPATGVPVAPGSAGTATVTVSRGGGFAGGVLLSAAVPKAAAGVTAAFGPPALSPAATQSRLTLATTAATPAGDYNIVVTAAGSGAASAQTTVVLRVGTGQRGIVLAAWPPGVTVPRGTAAAVALDVNRAGGFAGPVTLSVDAAPAGLELAFVPATLDSAATAATLTVRATDRAALGGPVELLLRARGAGVPDATFILPVTVAAPPGLRVVAAAPGLTVARGANAAPTRLALTVVRPSGFSGPVTFAVAAPAGVTAVATPAPLPAGRTGAELTVTAEAGAAAGNVVVTASGDGVQSGSVTLPVTYVAPLVTLTKPANMAAPQGTTAAVGITVARANMSGPVTVALVDPPAGITAPPLTIPAEATRGTLALTVAPGAAAGAGRSRCAPPGPAGRRWTPARSPSR
jgi:hypothetical protein